MSEELKPCPFCEAAALVDPCAMGWWVRCGAHQTIIHACAVGQTREEAIAFWNTRPDTEAEQRNALFSDCLHRASKIWCERHPEAIEKMMWPDGADCFAWLKDEVDRLEALA